MSKWKYGDVFAGENSKDSLYMFINFGNEGRSVRALCLHRAPDNLWWKPGTVEFVTAAEVKRKIDE